jgi:hypothetical protein
LLINPQHEIASSGYALLAMTEKENVPANRHILLFNSLPVPVGRKDETMNTYIFLTGDEYTFQPETEQEPVTIENLQMLGTAKGTDAMTAYRNLLADNPHLQEKSFEKIFCYQVDETMRKVESISI